MSRERCKEGCVLFIAVDFRLDFRRSLVSDLPSLRRTAGRVSSEEERGLLFQTATGNQA